MAASGSAIRRLMKDLQEVKENPLPNVVAQPLEENLFEWHVNIRTSDDDDDVRENLLSTATFHVVLLFPQNYPHAGPEVRLSTPLPHPNVELLSNHFTTLASELPLWKVWIWDCIPGFSGWTSVYSVQSVLLQLQTFLLKEELLSDTRKVQSLAGAAQRARKYVCQRCGHGPTDSRPQFLTPVEVQAILLNKKKRVISRPLPSSLIQQCLPSLSSSCHVKPSREARQSDAEWKLAGSKRKKRFALKSEVGASYLKIAKRSDPIPSLQILDDDHATSHASIDNMGSFGVLPQEALTSILALLPTESLGSLSRTCRGLRKACEEGYVWKTLLMRHYPTTSLQAASMEDWKHVFLLEQSKVVESLRCFHSKRTHEEDVLGFPISFTVNPRTRAVDYIQVHFDVLSQSAFSEGVHTTISNQKFDLLLPLYLTPNHFERALPLIQNVATQLCATSRTFHPEMILNFMPKILNTMVVLLSDKGVGASARVIEGYCMLHRLFLALCDRFNLWRSAEATIINFKSTPSARVKANCRDLGHLMALLSVCTSAQTSWSEIVQPLTGEVFDRSVVWICKNDSSAVELFKRAGRRRGEDKELLRAAWEGSTVALRLNLFHSAFLNLVARPAKTSLQKVAAGYDGLYGMPSAFTKKKLQTVIKSILEVEYDWPFFFSKMGLQCPSKEYLTGWLGQCWKNSLQKQYHDHRTKFESIHRRGVSTILLQGESYKVPPNLKGVRLNETWRHSGGGTQFLDASCLIYDNDGHFIDAVDYIHRRSVNSAVVHSGDMMDSGKNLGTHTIDIKFYLLPPNVQALFFTLSGFLGATLARFELPLAELVDVHSKMELCSYTLKSKALGSYRSVVMCCLHKKADKWTIDAIGHLGFGSADNYEPLKQTIGNLMKARYRPSPA